MSTPPTTFLLPHRPAAPVPMPIAIDCDPLMPMLSLPPAIGTNQNVLLPTAFSTTSFAPTPNLQQPKTENQASTLATGKQHFPMTITFHSRQLTTQRSPTHHLILPECISVPNSTLSQDRASPPHSLVLPAYLSAAESQELHNVGCASSEADQ